MMLKNSYGMQWAAIVREFEYSEKAQRLHNAEYTYTVPSLANYNEFRHRVIKLGLAQAKEQLRKYRFQFWVRSSLSTNQLLAHFLLVLQEQVERMEDIDSASRAGMVTALENWVSWLAMTDETVNDVIEVGWDTNRVL